MNRRNFIGGCVAGAVGAALPASGCDCGDLPTTTSYSIEISGASGCHEPEFLVEFDLLTQCHNLILHDGVNYIADIVTQKRFVETRGKAIGAAKERMRRIWNHEFGRIVG